MGLSKKFRESEAENNFGGCNKLRQQYQTIASELAHIEEKSGRFGSIAPSTLKRFRQATVFIQVEVLESYLEDLLNLEISEQELFIEPDTFGNRILQFSLLGLVFSTVCGVYAASSGASFLLSLSLTVCLASPFAVLWHFSPREATMRRVRYAQIVSHEVSRRRGRTGRGRPELGTTSVIESFITGKAKSSQGVLSRRIS